MILYTYSLPPSLTSGQSDESVVEILDKIKNKK